MCVGGVGGIQETHASQCMCVCYSITVDNWFHLITSRILGSWMYGMLVEWVGYKRPMQLQCICMCYSITVTNWFHLITSKILGCRMYCVRVFVCVCVRAVLSVLERQCWSTT